MESRTIHWTLPRSLCFALCLVSSCGLPVKRRQILLLKFAIFLWALAHPRKKHLALPNRNVKYLKGLHVLTFCWGLDIHCVFRSLFWYGRGMCIH